MRDRREFHYRGGAIALQRPRPAAGIEALDGYLHLRDNPADRPYELWQHEGCGASIVVTRDTVTHDVFGSELASDIARGTA